MTEVKINRNTLFSQNEDHGTFFRDMSVDARWSRNETYAGVVLGGGFQYAFTNNL